MARDRNVFVLLVYGMGVACDGYSGIKLRFVCRDHDETWRVFVSYDL